MSDAQQYVALRTLTLHPWWSPRDWKGAKTRDKPSLGVLFPADQCIYRPARKSLAVYRAGSLVFTLSGLSRLAITALVESRNIA